MILKMVIFYSQYSFLPCRLIIFLPKNNLGLYCFWENGAPFLFKYGAPFLFVQVQSTHTVILFQIRMGLTSFLWYKPISLYPPCVQMHQVYRHQSAFHMSAGDMGVREVGMASLLVSIY